MKVTRVIEEAPGLSEEEIDSVWQALESNGKYQFNKSHSVAYTMLSYWTMLLKVRYPAEFFASCMSILDSDRMPGLVADAARFNLRVGPPDINTSTDKFEVLTDPATGHSLLVAPFNSVANISEKGAAAIVAGRKDAGGAFADRTQFELSVNRRIVNKRVIDHLERVGAFASITPGSPSAIDKSRLKDQLTLMSGVMQQVAQIDRDMAIGKATKAKLLGLVNEWVDEYDDRWTCAPRIGKKANKVMVIFDAPNWSDENAGRLVSGKSYTTWAEIIKGAGLTNEDFYYTTLMKFVKDQESQGFEMDDITKCGGYLDREVAELNPPVILTMGSLATRHFSDDSRKKAAELIGKSHYDKENDRTVVYGFNQGRIHFNPDLESELKKCLSMAIEAAGM